jgi:phage anti-repressor protein
MIQVYLSYNLRLNHNMQLQMWVPDDTGRDQKRLGICVEKVMSAIENLLEDEGEQHNKIQS